MQTFQNSDRQIDRIDVKEERRREILKIGLYTTSFSNNQKGFRLNKKIKIKKLKIVLFVTII